MNLHYLLAILLIAVPLSFVWHAELVMDYNGGWLTNGFRIYDGMKVYHGWMYALFATNFVAAYIIISESKNRDKEGKIG